MSLFSIGRGDSWIVARAAGDTTEHGPTLTPSAFRAIFSGVSRISRRQALCLPALLAAAPPPRWRCEELRRHQAPEANQAVAVDESHFYAIGNHAIAKYDKKSGKRLAGWECERGKPLIHLNSGVVRSGALYCAHSTYPVVPMVSSIEIWDAKTLRHTGTHSFGIYTGSATWVDFRGDEPYVTFAHYRNRAAEPNRDPRWTSLVQFDSRWRRVQGWVYPPEVIAKLGDYSISGGVFTPRDRIFCTGHDNPEIYVLSFPHGGSTLILEDTFAVPNAGRESRWTLPTPAFSTASTVESAR